jgi:fructokinase
MHKILCIGEALIDMICTDTNTPLHNGINFLKKAGGAPTNVAAAIAALGGEVSLSAKVGTDPFGKHLIEVLNNFGVDTSFVLQDDKQFTTLAFVSLFENGERDFVFNRAADGALSIEDVDYSIVHFGSATAFLPGPLQNAYLHLLQTSVAAGKIISFDPNYRHLLFGHQQATFIAQSWHYLQHCTFFKVSDEEALLLTQTTTLQQAVNVFKAKTNASFAITLGKDGTLICANNLTTTIPSIPITPIDTTGAGDAFVGALLYQLARYNKEQVQQLPNTTWQTLISKANIAGAKTCEHMGAMEAFKHLNPNIFS